MTSFDPSIVEIRKNRVSHNNPMYTLNVFEADYIDHYIDHFIVNREQMSLLNVGYLPLDVKEVLNDNDCVDFTGNYGPLGGVIHRTIDGAFAAFIEERFVTAFDDHYQAKDKYKAKDNEKYKAKDNDEHKEKYSFNAFTNGLKYI